MQIVLTFRNSLRNVKRRLLHTRASAMCYITRRVLLIPNPNSQFKFRKCSLVADKRLRSGLKAQRLCKWEQSQACLSYAERSQSYAKMPPLKNSCFQKGSHTSLYAFLSAKKVFTPSHRVRFCLIFNGFECEGLDFQVFTSTVAFYRVYLLIFGWFSGVKAYAFHPSQAFTARVNALLPLWTLWNQSLHTRNPCKSEENEHCVNGWILFSGNKNVYTCA